jgi:hypothetical protein
MVPDGGLLLLGSSVYRRRGLMHRMYRKLHGNEGGEGLCWFAPSRVMNPRLPQSVIDQALANDAPKARAEYENVWREDVSDFVPLDVIEACTDWGVIERPRQRGVSYVGYHDAAGGTGRDSFSLALGHAEHADNRVVIDLVRERKPRFVAEDVIAEYARLLHIYGVSSVMGDGYAAGFTADAWERNRVRFVKCDNTTAENYLAALPLLTSNRARLLDDATLRTQLSSLERKVVGGSETVTHPASASSHDDVAAAVCGCLVAAGDAANAPMHIPAGVLTKLGLMGSYNSRRSMGGGRSGEALFGERRWAQMQAMQNKRTYGW